MRFLLHYAPVEFEIPDEWWLATRAEGFRLCSQTYRPVPDADSPAIVVPISHVAPPTRDPGVTWFHRDRMIPILRGLIVGDSLLPIEAHVPPAMAEFQYAVRNGFHRFYVSAALGFSHVPLAVLPFFDIRSCGFSRSR